MELIAIDVRPGHSNESQSGLQLMRPRIWGAFHRAAGARTAAVVIHPTSNFMGHYLLEPLHRRGIAALGLNTRYLGSDVALLLERAIQDLGAGAKWLKSQGYERVVLIGNSGGGALVSLYQAQAEHLDIEATPTGDPVHLQADDLPSAQAIVLSAAHLGRSRLLQSWLDPAVIDENDLLASDPALDMFNPANGPPYSTEFLARYRTAQRKRLERIEHWAWAKLRQLRALCEGPRDLAFTINRTLADPRCLDPALDSNDRKPATSVWGPPFEQNYAANSMGRFTTINAFLSQWASCSRGDGPVNLAKTTVPVLLVEHTADASTFPSDHETWSEAARGRIIRRRLVGANHYLAGQPDLIEELADHVTQFAAAL